MTYQQHNTPQIDADAQRNRIENVQAAEKLAKWLHGSKGKPDQLKLLYVHEEKDSVIAAAVSLGNLCFCRLFPIGDTWEISLDESINVDEIARAGKPAATRQA